MTDKAISPLRRRLIDDMAIRRLRPRPQIIESTFDRVRYGFTTIFLYHILWW